MQDNCFSLDARRILEWAMQTLTLTTAKLPKLGWVNLAQNFRGQPTLKC